MAEGKAALSRVRVKLATLENSLKKRIVECLNALPEEERLKFTVSPSPSMNSTFDESPSLMSTPTKASTVVRKLSRGTSSSSETSVNSVWSGDSER